MWGEAGTLAVRRLADAAPRWHTIAHQVALGNYMREKDGVVQSSDDQWSGYLDSRRRLLDHIQKVGFGNVVTACGDAHRHYASDLVQDHRDSGVVSSEFSPPRSLPVPTARAWTRMP